MERDDSQNLVWLIFKVGDNGKVEIGVTHSGNLKFMILSGDDEAEEPIPVEGHTLYDIEHVSNCGNNVGYEFECNKIWCFDGHRQAKSEAELRHLVSRVER